MADLFLVAGNALMFPDPSLPAMKDVRKSVYIFNKIARSQKLSLKRITNE
ncbi:hypothetical protein SD77_0687 [Bacillus badius]|uniref:Uncharacterized protein n=1 Tax=Bacillus badius TaxID=1455 RepID=A0ABR5ATK2_BACBA|nr:hypothetical protein SD78_4068 [Bacillus badius]KIL78086.1 hypothetical protein SD77_0687 [Bacillus badius]